MVPRTAAAADAVPSRQGLPSSVVSVTTAAVVVADVGAGAVKFPVAVVVPVVSWPVSCEKNK